MKKFEAPELEILMFDVMDVIAASVDEDIIPPTPGLNEADYV